MRRLLAESRVARLATVDPDGRPNLVPMVFALEGETLYSSVDAKPKTSRDLRRVENIRQRPDAVTVLADHYDEEWETLWWVRVRARGRLLDAGPDHARALELLGSKYPQHDAATGDQGVVIALDSVSWRGWSWRRLE